LLLRSDDTTLPAGPKKGGPRVRRKISEIAMNVSDAVDRRMTVRAFLPEPVETEVLLRVLEKAGRAPSGGNLQPWRVTVLNGEVLDRFRAIMEERLKTPPDAPEYPVYPEKLSEPYRSRRFKVGEDMYALLDIRLDEKPKRWAWFHNNFRFFGAPAALFLHVDRQMGAAQWSDLGMFLQTVMLLLQEEGLDSCPQEAWSQFHKTVDAFTGVSPKWMLFCGMGVGKRDPEHPVNALRSDRAPLEEWVKVL
jgi:nitroreductase